MKMEKMYFSKSGSGERTKKKKKQLILLVAPLGLVAHIVPWLSLREFCYLQTSGKDLVLNTCTEVYISNPNLRKKNQRNLFENYY